MQERTRAPRVFDLQRLVHGSWERPESYVGRADVFGVSAPGLPGIYVVPVGAVSRFEGRLRLEPAANGQRKKIRPAEAYAFERWDPEGIFACVEHGAPVVIC